MRSLNSTGSILEFTVRALAPAVTLAMMFMIAMPRLAAQSFTILHSFTGASDGGYPNAGLVIDRGGHLYGTTYGGGVLRGNCEMYGTGCGTVFELSQRRSAWVLTPLYDFQGGADGALPQVQLTIGPNGSLYGTTAEGGNEVACFGGCGTVFNLRPPQRATANVLGNWGEAQLYLFQEDADGLGPLNGPLLFDRTGHIFGSTAYGGPNNAGTIYELTPAQGSWIENVIYSFQGGRDGAQPMSGLLQDTAGNLYGTTYRGGNGFGTVYELTPSGSGWTKTTVYSFEGINDGQYPIGGLIMDSAGNLFGTTSGGSGGGASIYQLIPTQSGWSLTTLHYYVGSLPGGGPTASLTMDAAGRLYGTAFEYGESNRGSVFKLTRLNGGWVYGELHSFVGGTNDGEYPYGAVTIDGNGNLYGTTINGGPGGCTSGCGVVWQIAPQSPL